MDVSAMLKIKQLLDTFTRSHPRVPGFIQNVKTKGFTEGQEIAVAIRYPDGTEYKTGIRVQASDLQVLQGLQDLAKQGR